MHNTAPINYTCKLSLVNYYCCLNKLYFADENNANGPRRNRFTPIEGATAREFTPSTEEAGINRYRVVVTNTNNNRRITGRRLARARSRIVIVEVLPYEYAGEEEITVELELY